MKRGKIFLITILFMMFSLNYINGQSISEMMVDCSGGNPPKVCLIYISEEFACDAYWSNQCHIWADNNGDGIDSCWTLPYTGLSTCCPIGEGSTGPGGAYHHSIYDKGTKCCDEVIPGAGLEGDELGQQDQYIQEPYSEDEDFNGYKETDCCPGLGSFKEDENQDGRQDKVCCSNNDGTKEIKNLEDGGCMNCCECLTFHEERDNDNICRRNQALSIKCREKYNFPICNLYDENCNKDYPDSCAVAMDPGQYEGVDDPAQNYQQCINRGLGGEFLTDYENDFNTICDQIDVPSKNQCPFYARQGSPGEHACGDDGNGNYLILVKVYPSCQCETDFYRCCKSTDTNCLNAGVTC